MAESVDWNRLFDEDTAIAPNGVPRITCIELNPHGDQNCVWSTTILGGANGDPSIVLPDRRASRIELRNGTVRAIAWVGPGVELWLVDISPTWDPHAGVAFVERRPYKEADQIIEFDTPYIVIEPRTYHAGDGRSQGVFAIPRQGPVRIKWSGSDSLGYRAKAVDESGYAAIEIKLVDAETVAITASGLEPVMIERASRPDDTLVA